MAENSILGYEYFPTSRVQQRADTKETIKKSVESKEKEVLEYRARLEKVEIKDGKYEQITTAAKEDLTKLYAKAGIRLKDEDFPKLYLIPHEYKKEFGGEKDMPAFFGSKPLGAIVYIRGKDHILNEVKSIHHELHHGIGRIALTIRSNERAEFGQIGLFVVGKRFTGEALEEGLMEYFSRSFIINSNQQDILNATKNYAGLMGYEKVKGVGKRDCVYGIRSKRKAKRVYRKILKHYNAPEYEDSRSAANQMVETLINKAVMVYGKTGGEKIKTLLLRTRKFPEEKRNLVEFVNNLFQNIVDGKKTNPAQTIFNTPDSYNEIIKTNTSLKS